MIKLATVFSGIGAPEEALKQLGADFEIVFACDNGERELKIEYDEIMTATENMSYEERLQYISKLYIQTKKENYVKQSYLGKKGFEWVTTRDKHQGRSRVNRDIIGCQTANQQFNWTGDFRLESPTEEMRADGRIYIGEYDGRECVARKLTPSECLRLMGFENFNIVVNDNNAYRQSGNSIAVPVLKALYKSIFDKLEI